MYKVEAIGVPSVQQEVAQRGSANVNGVPFTLNPETGRITSAPFSSSELASIFAAAGGYRVLTGSGDEATGFKTKVDVEREVQRALANQSNPELIWLEGFTQRVSAMPAANRLNLPKDELRRAVTAKGLALDAGEDKASMLDKLGFAVVDANAPQEPSEEPQEPQEPSEDIGDPHDFGRRYLSFTKRKKEETPKALLQQALNKLNVAYNESHTKAHLEELLRAAIGG